MTHEPATFPPQTPPADHPLLNRPVAFKLPFSRFKNGPPFLRVEVVASEFTADGLTPTRWAVREGGCVLNFAGDWEYEPIPSCRTREFLATTRWPTAFDAANAAARWHNHPLPNRQQLHEPSSS